MKRSLTADESLDGAAATAESMMANSATACRIVVGLVPFASNRLTIAFCSELNCWPLPYPHLAGTSMPNSIRGAVICCLIS